MLKVKVRSMWEQRVATYKASNQILSAWCKVNDVRPATLRYWIREFRVVNTSTEKVTSWISVDTTESKASTKEQPLIVKIGNASMEINIGFNKDLFSVVTEVLLSLC